MQEGQLDSSSSSGFLVGYSFLIPLCRFLQISEIYVSGESGDLTAKEKLLIWSQQATEGYPGLRCSNFTSSWSDGRMFNALLHRYRSDQ